MNTYTIQTVDRAFSGRIPAGLWQTVGHGTTPRGVARVYGKQYHRYHPQPGAWTGHVRIVRDRDGMLMDLQYTYEGDPDGSFRLYESGVTLAELNS